MTEQQIEFPELPEWYDKPSVSFTGVNSNAFNLMGIVANAIKRQRHQYPEYREGYITQEKEFYKYAKMGDYNHLLRACMHWADIDFSDEDEDEEDYFSIS